LKRNLPQFPVLFRQGSIGIKDLLCQDKGDGCEEETDSVID
jgi:hypothetical protein